MKSANEIHLTSRERVHEGKEEEDKTKRVEAMERERHTQHIHRQLEIAILKRRIKWNERKTRQRGRDSVCVSR